MQSALYDERCHTNLSYKQVQYAIESASILGHQEWSLCFPYTESVWSICNNFICILPRWQALRRVVYY
jgi:hypothetical protein